MPCVGDGGGCTAGRFTERAVLPWATNAASFTVNDADQMFSNNPDYTALPDLSGPGLDSTTFDLVLKNNPTFIANTAKHYLFIQEIGNDSPKYLARGKAGFRDLLADLLTGKGTLEQSEWAWEEMFA